MTEQTAPKEETAFISDNLNNFNRLAQTYTSLRDVEKVDGDQVNEVLSGHRRLKYYLEAADLVDGEGNIGKKLFLPIGQSRHLDDVLWEIKHPLLERIDRELYMFDEEETFVNSYEQALEEYKTVRTIRVYIEENARDSEQKRQILASLDVAERVTQLATVEKLLNCADKAFMLDAVANSDVPLVDRELDMSKWDDLTQEEKHAGGLLVNLYTIATLKAGVNIRQAYENATHQLKQDEQKAAGVLEEKPLGDYELYKDSQEILPRHFHQRHHRDEDEEFEHGYVRKIAHDYEFNQQAVDYEFKHIAMAISEGLVSLDPTVGEVQRLYDLVLPYLFSENSWYISINALSTMRDPRALFVLLDQLQQSQELMGGEKHAEAIVNIANNPLSPKIMDQYLQTASDEQKFAVEMANNPLVRQIVMKDNSSSPNRLWNRNVRVLPELLLGSPKRLANLKFIEIYIDYAKQKGISVDKNEYSDMLNTLNMYSGEAAIKLFTANLDEIVPLLAKKAHEIGFADWENNMPELYKAVVGYKDGTGFVLELALAIGISTEAVSKLEALYLSKDLRGGEHSKKEILNGIIVFLGKNGSSETLETIVSKISGTKEDPKRVRRIFRMLTTLNDLGRLDLSHSEMFDGGSLDEIANTIQNKLAEVVKEKLNLTTESISPERWDKLFSEGSLDMVMSLYAQYTEKSKDSAASLILEIGKHIVIGDFAEWRNTNPFSKEILEYYLPNPNQQIAWLTPIEPIKRLFKLSREEQILGVVGEINRIASEAKSHAEKILNVGEKPLNFFSEENLTQLEKRRQIVETQIKNFEEGGGISLKNLRRTKDQLDDQLRIINGIQYLLNLSIEDFNQGGIRDTLKKTISTLIRMQNLQQSAADLQQIEKTILPTLNKIVTEVEVTGQDTDDYMSLFKAGMEPRETCQSVRNGSHNYCLPTTIATPDIRLDNSRIGSVVENRALSKLKKMSTELVSDQTVIMLEPPYGLSETHPGYVVTLEIAIKKAENVGVPLVIAQPIDMATGADHATTISLLDMVARNNGARVTRVGNVNLHGKKGIGEYEYSDTLGETIDFDVPVAMEEVYVVYPQNVAMVF